MSTKSNFILSGFLMLGMVLAVSCDPAKSKAEEEAELIRMFVEDNNITVEPTSTGLYYIETLAGTGLSPALNDSVVVYYSGYYLDGVLFDSNINTEPIVFAVGTNAVIYGFEEGISYMKEGGKARLLMPSSLAYGPYGTAWMPAYTPLYFDVELVDVIQDTGK